MSHCQKCEGCSSACPACCMVTKVDIKSRDGGTGNQNPLVTSSLSYVLSWKFIITAFMKNGQIKNQTFPGSTIR